MNTPRQNMYPIRNQICSLTSHTKINSKWSVLNVRLKNTKFIEENVGSKKLFDTGIGNDF